MLDLGDLSEDSQPRVIVEASADIVYDDDQVDVRVGRCRSVRVRADQSHSSDVVLLAGPSGDVNQETRCTTHPSSVSDVLFNAVVEDGAALGGPNPTGQDEAEDEGRQSSCQVAWGKRHNEAPVRALTGRSDTRLAERFSPLCEKGGASSQKRGMVAPPIASTTLLGGLRMTSRIALASGVTLELDEEALARIVAQLPNEDGGIAAVPNSVLPDGHPMWEHHSGGDRHQAPDFGDGDEYEALITRRGLSPKASVFFEELLSAPGQLLSSDHFVTRFPEVFESASAIAGALNGFRRHCDRAGRAFPFCWWEGRGGVPTRYAIRPAVAQVFLRAGR